MKKTFWSLVILSSLLLTGCTVFQPAEFNDLGGISPEESANSNVPIRMVISGRTIKHGLAQRRFVHRVRPAAVISTN